MSSSLPLIVGNWKMHGLLSSAKEYAARLTEAVLYHRPACDIVICPPVTLLHSLSPLLQQSPVKLGAQDCHSENQGAFTGDVSAIMLKETQCQYVLTGHSERRVYHHETNELVQKKASAALKDRLISIICIGETLKEREEGHTKAVLEKQLTHSLPEAATAENVIIAYEPVWAIGTGVTPALEQIDEAHRVIHEQLAGLKKEGQFRVLYGGSVKAENAAEIIHLASVQGLLVGGASVSFHDFWDVIISATLRQPHSFSS